MKLQSDMQCDPRVSVRSCRLGLRSGNSWYRVCSGLCSTDWN